MADPLFGGLAQRRRDEANRRVAAGADAPVDALSFETRVAELEQSVLAAEARSLAQLVTGLTAQNLVRVFFLQEQLKGLGKDKTYKGCADYNDFRELIARKDIDAVVIATPDFWHAEHAIACMEAGLDVYCEKEMSNTLAGARKMVEAAKKHNRIVQVGLHRRSSQMYADLATQVQAGKIGKVTVARAYRVHQYFDG